MVPCFDAIMFYFIKENKTSSKTVQQIYIYNNNKNRTTVQKQVSVIIFIDMI